MRNTIALLSLLAAVLVGCASPPRPATVEANDVSTVPAFLTGYLKAIETRDEAAIRSAYVSGDRLAWLEDGKLRYRSADEVLAGLKSIPVASPIRTTLTDLVVVPLGSGAAHARASFATTIGAPPGAFTFGGAVTFALERQGGAWKIVAGHTSSPGRR